MGNPEFSKNLKHLFTEGTVPVPPNRPCALRWCRITSSGVIAPGDATAGGVVRCHCHQKSLKKLFWGFLLSKIIRCSFLRTISGTVILSGSSMWIHIRSIVEISQKEPIVRLYTLSMVHIARSGTLSVCIRCVQVPCYLKSDPKNGHISPACSFTQVSWGLFSWYSRMNESINRSGKIIKVDIRVPLGMQRTGASHYFIKRQF